MSPALLTGMHRSGTSALARLVQALGVDIGSNLLPAAGGNLFGHFEETAFIHFHDKLIARLFPERAPFCEWLPVANARIVYTEADRAEARSIWEAHRAKGGKAWKDPRTSLFLDLWKEVLPDVKMVISLRHPYQVHRSLLRRGEPFLHVDYSASILGWIVYNQRILDVISTLPKNGFILIDVDLAFRKPRKLTESLAQFLGLPLTEKAFASIDPASFHFEGDSDQNLEHFEAFFPEAGTIYRRLKQFDALNPKSSIPSPATGTPEQGSAECRLIEYEERHGLREKAKAMLIRSISIDRQRTADFYKQLAKVEEEKDRLIDDLSQLNALLKRRVAELEKS